MHEKTDFILWIFQGKYWLQEFVQERCWLFNENPNGHGGQCGLILEDGQLNFSAQLTLFMFKGAGDVVSIVVDQILAGTVAVEDAGQRFSEDVLHEIFASCFVVLETKVIWGKILSFD